MGKRSLSKLVRETSTFREELLRRSSEYESLHSERSYCEFLDLLKESIFLYIVCKEENGIDLLNSEDFKRFSNLLNDKEKELRTTLSAVLFYANKNSEGIPNTLVFEFTTFDDKALKEAAIFLSFVLSMNYPENKRDLLLVHYLLVRKAAAKFSNVGTQENLSDDLLYDLFKLAISFFKNSKRGKNTIYSEFASTALSGEFNHESIRISCKREAAKNSS
jgi:hypothetical protein